MLVETGVFTVSSHVVNAGMNVLSPSNTSDFERSLSISISWPESLDAPPPTTLYPCVCVCVCVTRTLSVLCVRTGECAIERLERSCVLYVYRHAHECHKVHRGNGEGGYS